MRALSNIFLYPLSLLYGLAVSFRNYLFDRGILNAEIFDVPVISIGNLTVGGTGKTPHTEYIIILLKKRCKVAVLSRGYKRRSKGFVLADEQSDSSTLGDELYQMHRKFPEIIVAADADRRRGIRRLLDLPPDIRPEVILLDDAFQHRYVKPSLSILLCDNNRPVFKDRLLPAGRLRESASNFKRADIVIITKYSELFDTIPVNKDYPMFDEYVKRGCFFKTSYKYRSLVPLASEKTKNIPVKNLKEKNYSVLLVTGIADSKEIVRFLEQKTDFLQHLAFADHHSFTRKDFNTIIEKFTRIENKKKIIIVTEKDAVRMENNPDLPDEIRQSIYYLPVTVSFIPWQELLFDKKIEKHVAEFKRNSGKSASADT